MSETFRKIVTSQTPRAEQLDVGENAAAAVRDFPKLSPAAAEQLGGEEAVRRFFEEMRRGSVDPRLSTNLDSKRKDDK